MIAAPGAGKGTQAQRLAARYRIPHISSGDQLRKEVESESDIGTRVSAYLVRGDLVPDDLVLEILAGQILEAAALGGYVLDGFPRTLSQAEQAYQLARQVPGVELQAVIHLEVGPAELRRRLLGRAAVDGRSDDNEEIIEHRLEVYERETRPMLDFYRRRGILVDVSGEKPPDLVFADIVGAVESLLSASPEQPGA
jgi:adenylate kinase